MRNNKLLSIALLGVVLSIGACSNNTSSNVELKVIEGVSGEYEISTPIDTGTFFYCSNYKLKSTSVTYTKDGNKVTDKVNGEIFIPTNRGEHVFTCSAGTKSVSKTITVLDQKPFISVDSSTYFHVIDTSYPYIYLEDLTNNISCTVSPSSATLKLDSVQYTPFNLKIDKGESEYTTVAVEDDHFKAEKLGHYKVNVSAVNGERSASGTFNVIVSDNKNGGDERVKKQTEKKYCSNRVVVDSSNPKAFLLPAADFKKGASFVTLKTEWDYETQREAGGTEIPHETIIKFKGKNIPSIGIYTQPNSTSGSFSNTAINSGYIVTWEQNSIKDRYSVTHTNVSYVWKTVYSTAPYLALGIQDLDDDTYYRLKIGLRTRNNGEGKYGHDVGWDIEKIENYGTEQEKYVKLFTPGAISGDDRSETDMYVPYAKGGWSDTFSDAKGYITLYSSSLKDITFEVTSEA